MVGKGWFPWINPVLKILPHKKYDSRVKTAEWRKP